MRTTDLDEPALKRAQGCLVSTRRARISKRAKLIPPVIIGQDVTVAAGACVGPFAVLTDGVVMAKNSRLQFGILAGGMSVENGGLASGVIGVGGVVARVPFPGCRESLVRGVASLPASRRFNGVPLAKGTTAPRA